MIYRIVITTLIFTALGCSAYAADLYSRPDGTWSLTDGGADCGCTPTQNDNIYVNHDISIAGDFVVKGILEVDNNATLTINGTGNLTIDGTGEFYIRSGSTVNVNNNLEFKNGATVLVEEGATLNVGGNLTNRNNSDTIIFNGTVTVDGDLNNGTGGTIDGTGSLDVGGTVNNDGTIGGSTSDNTGSLPVELLYYRGEVAEETVRLYWATEWEENFAFFTVEKSLDGEVYDSVGSVAGIGSPTLGQEYDWTDPAPSVGRAYYRLKATDWDGFTEYHGVVVLETWQVAPRATAFPNPVSEGTFSIGTNFTLQANQGHLLLINLQGQQVWEHEIVLQNHYSLPTHLPTGTYTLVLTHDTERIKMPLVIR